LERQLTGIGAAASFCDALARVDVAVIAEVKRRSPSKGVLDASLDAGTRMWMGPREDSYSPPTPLGSSVIGMVVGPVVESRHPVGLDGLLDAIDDE